MSDDLVKRARHNALADMPHYASVELVEVLADRIEQLAATNEELEAQNTDALREAKVLAKALHRRFYQGQAPQWKTLEDVVGIISQIDNMAAGMADRIEELEAKLAKAVEAAEKAVGHIERIPPRIATARVELCDALAELKGQDYDANPST